MQHARPPAAAPAHDILNLSRAHNERRWLLEKGVVQHDERAPFVYECASRDCVRLIELTMHEFEAVHMCPNWHAVPPGHASLADEVVLLREDHFWIVEANER
jgi:hypothetical protein